MLANSRLYQVSVSGELAILRPDVLVTQGAEAKKAVESLYGTLESFDEYASKIGMDGRGVFWLRTYHPACWGRFNGQRDFDKTRNRARGWEKYSRMIREFVEWEA